MILSIVIRILDFISIDVNLMGNLMIRFLNIFDWGKKIMF